MISALFAVVGLALMAMTLIDAFETMILPRRISRLIRFTRFYYFATWRPWLMLARKMEPGKRREWFLSLYGPLSILSLLGTWAIGLIVGFGMLHMGLRISLSQIHGSPSWLDYLYLSGVTFFTLGFGDLTPSQPLGRFVIVVEAGVGFGFLALVIGYLPVLYQSFSKREATISLMDARAGSPPTAAELLIRVMHVKNQAALVGHFEAWEQWCAELLESHISFPVLCFYRSQHDNQSWLGTLTMILDASALVLSEAEGADPYSARLAFAMARHAVVDLSQFFSARPMLDDADRLDPERLARLRDELTRSGWTLRPEAEARSHLIALRAMYEPFVMSLSRFFLITIPPILADKPGVDNWQTSAWMRRTSGIRGLSAEPGDDHDD